MSELADRINRKLTNREQILDTLLTHYLEAQETLYSGTTAGGMGDDRVFQMPAIWRDCPSYHELKRVLEQIRAEPAWKRYKGHHWSGWCQLADGRKQFGLYWHLGQWYFQAAKLPKPRTKKVLTKKGWEEKPDGRKMVVFRHPDVEPAAVLLGLELVSSLFRGEPFYPRHRDAKGNGCGKPLFGPNACLCGVVTESALLTPLEAA